MQKKGAVKRNMIKENAMAQTKDASSVKKVKVQTKAVGLNAEMLDQVQEDDDLACILKLHDFVQRVRNKNNDNKTQISELKTMFEDLNEKIQGVYKEQKDIQVVEKKKDDKGKK
eukprot:CAMPEP_0176377712 /NCGR_PEP_ID=MMETSP0126-20121128/29090_1 /TAXON_ID=141414 ORGANISM="Strombidinopsis acuminatum, Strain SPMC142" /NCGR_SAMPLE_ID=MMETSP0126 /ASSEMBLY_ACC=CAM_ASM_000229 /LENGTH=113 /DNA_ID=CAMNT_0017739679 /DNA_START=15 /DNA_END=356 /DNA_ORIENTATION=+